MMKSRILFLMLLANLCAATWVQAESAVPAESAAIAVAKEWVVQFDVDILAGTRLADRLEGEAGPEAALWRFRVISHTLEAMGMSTEELKAPAAAWLEKHKEEVVYSEPAGQYYVRQDGVWALYEKSKATPLAEEIAWEAANTPLAGECEGYLPCYAGSSLESLGRYLELYPRGKWTSEGLDSLYWMLDPMSPEEFPLDAQDLGECSKIFAKWRQILKSLSGAEKQRQGLEKLAKSYGVK